jgi:DNA-binding NtrC family response regulator
MFAAPAGDPSAGANVPTILLVEDEVLIRMATADALRSAGFTVIEAAHADEALSILHASVSVDLVMTDVRMPGSMDGLALSETLRASRPGLKLVIVSGELIAVPVRSVADLFFSKPVNLAVVIEKITKLLEERP